MAGVGCWLRPELRYAALSIDGAVSKLPVEEHEDLLTVSCIFLRVLDVAADAGGRYDRMITGAALVATGLTAVAYLCNDPKARVFDTADSYPLDKIVALQTSLVAVAMFVTYCAVVNLEGRLWVTEPLQYQSLGRTALLLS